MEQLKLRDLTIDVVLKDIKNIHLSVYPPSGRVRISAPLSMNIDTIRIYTISKLGWIKKQQDKFHNQVREAPREYLNKEGHYFSGKRYLIKVVEHNASPIVKVKHNTIEMYVRPNSGIQKKKAIMDKWYRGQLKELIPPIIEKWEKLMNITINEFAVKKMKTKWGTCNREAKRIWLNLELAKKPVHCIEYIIVHEMVHLRVRTHNDEFYKLLDFYYPQWKSHKQDLNRLPISHSIWKY
jgi:predicted metal-dependent hydrolase